MSKREILNALTNSDVSVIHGEWYGKLGGLCVKERQAVVLQLLQLYDSDGVCYEGKIKRVLNENEGDLEAAMKVLNREVEIFMLPQYSNIRGFLMIYLL